MGEYKTVENARRKRNERERKKSERNYKPTAVLPPIRQVSMHDWPFWLSGRFGRHGGPASLGVYAAEGGRQLLTHPVCQRLDPLDQVFLWDQVLGGEHYQSAKAWERPNSVVQVDRVIGHPCLVVCPRHADGSEVEWRRTKGFSN